MIRRPIVTTAASLVVLYHTELGVGVGVTVLRRIVTTSTDVLLPVTIKINGFRITFISVYE